MTGAEHFELAECHLDDAENAAVGSDEERYSIRAAQVHATLALASAGLEEVPA